MGKIIVNVICSILVASMGIGALIFDRDSGDRSDKKSDKKKEN